MKAVPVPESLNLPSATAQKQKLMAGSQAVFPLRSGFVKRHTPCQSARAGRGEERPRIPAQGALAGHEIRAAARSSGTAAWICNGTTSLSLSSRRRCRIQVRNERCRHKKHQEVRQNLGAKAGRELRAVIW